MSGKKKTAGTGLSRNERRERLMGYILMAPATILLFAFTVYPLCYLVYRSLFGGNLITANPDFVGMENYATLLESGDFHTVLLNTLEYTLITVGFTIVLAVVLAAWLNSKKNKSLNGVTQTLMFTPHIISMVSVATLFLWMMDSKNGLFNTVLSMLGLPEGTWISDPKTALWSVALVIPFISNPFGIFLLRQYFMQVPSEVIEAAKLDNASEIKVMFRIMMPMAKSALITIGLLSFISNWNNYFWPLIMTSKDAFRTLPIGIALLKDADSLQRWNVIMAGNLLLVLPMLVLYILASKKIRNAFVYSGIK